jgi:penicillin-binding protein 1A
LRESLNIVDRFGKSVPYPFVRILIEAEDHRNAYHPGVDPIGIVRAVWVYLKSGHIQGASTIEQQFVRVVTGSYKRSPARKLREQLLAIAVTRQRPKSSIASAYLAIAFFGSGCVGLAGMKSHLGCRFHRTSAHEALRFVSQLKYPRPLQPDRYWYAKIHARCDAIWSRRKLATNRSLQHVFKPNPTCSLESANTSNTTYLND